MTNEFNFLDTTEKTQIKSKERVASRGEVFTAEREVKAMCDLVKDETQRIDSRFLEPACGDGNFLAEILIRKLNVVTKKYKKAQSDWEKYSLLAVSSLYGIDIMSDNAEECRRRLFSIWQAEYEKVSTSPLSIDLEKSIAFILSKNICTGNALTLKIVDEKQNDTKDEIVFSEWSLLGDKIKRRDFSFNGLVNQEYMKEDGGLFSDLGEEAEIFSPEKEFPLISYRRVYEQSE